MASNIILTKHPGSDPVPSGDGSRQRKVIRAPSLSLSRIRTDLISLVQYRDLLYTLSVHRVKVRYKQSVLGVAWAILQPVMLMLIYTLIFSLFAKMPSGGLPYALFAFAALLPWLYFSTALSNATGGLVSHSSLVTKVYFPREILPLTYVVAALFDFVIASSVLAGLMVYYDVSVTLNLLYALPIVIILTVFIIAVSFFLSATQVHFRDIAVGIPLLLQLWMFATPVVYPLSVVPERFRPLYVLNPMVGIVEGFRQAVLHGAVPDLSLLGISAAVSFILLPVSYLYFKHVEATLADVI